MWLLDLSTPLSIHVFNLKSGFSGSCLKTSLCGSCSYFSLQLSRSHIRHGLSCGLIEGKEMYGHLYVSFLTMENLYGFTWSRFPNTNTSLFVGYFINMCKSLRTKIRHLCVVLCNLCQPIYTCQNARSNAKKWGLQIQGIGQQALDTCILPQCR
jgi:hypothetical protein